MKDKTFTLRIEKSTLEKLDRAIDCRRESKSSFVRRAVLRELARYDFLSEKEKRALGVRENEG